MSFLIKMRVLVTGCAGLLGSKFCDWLVENVQDIQIIGVDNLQGGLVENIHPEVQFIKADLSNPEEQNEIKKCFPVDYIFHFAAYAAECLSPFIRQFNYINNTVSTAFLINCAIEFGVQRFVFTSSMAVYGRGQAPFDENDTPRPIDPYGVAKFACEMDLQIAAEQHGLDYCIIRPHNVYGPKQNIWDPYRNVLGIWMYKSLRNEPITVYGTGDQTRAFSYIDDILPCLWNAAIFDKARNQIINLGGMKEYSLNTAKDIISQVTGNKNVVYLEPRHEVKHSYCLYQKSIDILDYKETVTFEQGIGKMWEWVLQQPQRERKLWNQYEIEKNIYSYWKVK